MVLICISLGISDADHFHVPVDDQSLRSWLPRDANYSFEMSQELIDLLWENKLGYCLGDTFVDLLRYE